MFGDVLARPVASDTVTAPVPSDYSQTLDLLKQQVRSARFTAQRRVNTELVLLYWRIGVVILDRQQRSGWGSSVIATLSDDLRAAFPSMTGFSRRNLNYMRALARAWPDESKVQQVVALLPWGHVTVLLGRFDDQRLRDWYAERTVHHGWSRNVLEHHIRTSAHERFEAAPTNFERALAPDASDLAAQMTKDPYVLDFLALDGDASERVLEQRLVERIVETLRELGTGFAFVGRQAHFEVGGDDFFVDLLFFHVDQLRYVVVELKTGRFRPDQLGQLSFYVSVVDDRLRGPAHAETVGLLLVADKNESTVRYALGTQHSPVGVASYDLLPPEVRAALPSEDALAGLLAAAAA